MGEIKSYKDLIVWQKSIAMVSLVYESTKFFPTEERFGLTSQIRRSAVSVPSNIAEGWGRNSTKNYIQFLKISKGSLFELETQILISKNLEFITQSANIDKLITEIGKMLNTLITKLETKL